MKKITVIAIIMVLFVTLLAGCTTTKSTALDENMQQQAEDMAKNQSGLEQKIPVPPLDYSNNRANIVKRLSTSGSDQNKVSWIYCFTPSGQLVLFTSVKGCVTNLSAYAVPDDNILDHRIPGVGTYAMTVQAPDADGTYGTNGDGIFWYDTAGVYHEWNSVYMLVDQPIKLSVEPLVTMNIEAK